LPGVSSAGTKTVASESLGFGEHVVRSHVQRDGALCFASLGDEFLLGLDNRLTGFLAELERGVEVGSVISLAEPSYITMSVALPT